MNFKIKICDSRRPDFQGFATFFESNEDTYQMLKPGDKIRILNASPAN